MIIVEAIIQDNKIVENPRFKDCSEAVGLIVTYQCNLRCKYCYVHTKRNEFLTFNNAKSILEPLLKKQGGLLDIKFYGGETLLAKKLIIQIVEWVKSVNWDRQYRFFGSTNGILLDEELKTWLRNNAEIVTLGLSYDGVPAIQLSNRGFSDIDIDFFIKTWPYQPIQMTINEQSVHKMSEGIIYLLRKGASVHPNVAFEKKEWNENNILEYGRQLSVLIDFYLKNPCYPLIEQFRHNLEEYVSNINEKKIQRQVCGAGLGFRVYDTDGKSYPCHLFSPLVMDSFLLNSVCSSSFLKSEDCEDPKCYLCPFITTCPTCIACNFMYRGNIKLRDITHCKIMKLEVKAFIKMEVLRLLKKEKLNKEDALEIDHINKLVEHESHITSIR